MKGKKIIELEAWKCFECDGIYVKETCDCEKWSEKDKKIILVEKVKK